MVAPTRPLQTIGGYAIRGERRHVDGAPAEEFRRIWNEGWHASPVHRWTTPYTRGERKSRTKSELFLLKAFLYRGLLGFALAKAFRHALAAFLLLL